MADLPHVGTRQFRRELKAFLAAVERTGQSLVVTRHGKPVALLLPPAKTESED